MASNWLNLTQTLQGLVKDAEPKDEEEQEEEQKRREEAETALNRLLIEIHSRLRACDEADSASAAAANSVSAVRKSSSGHEPQIPPPPQQQVEADEGEGDDDGEDEDEDNEAPSTPVLKHALPLAPNVAKTLIEECAGVLLRHRGRSASHALAAQLIAELARADAGRDFCLAPDTDVVKAAARVLEEQADMKEGALETAVQILRVLGNLCYNNKDGRSAIIAVPKCLEHVRKIASNRERVSNEDPGQRFPVILPSFLLNFVNDCKEAVIAAGKVGFVPVVVNNVLSTRTNDAVFNGSLNFLVAMAEEPEGAGLEFLRIVAFPEAVNHVLQHTTSPEVTETALELIRSVSQDSRLTFDLAKSPICTTLIKHILGRWRSPEFQDHRGDACDLLVLILSHDESMKHIYSTDNGKFQQTFLGWLKKDDVQLKVAASLAIGNFACSEKHCEQLMENKVSVQLISLLKAHQNPHTDLKLQHAILGAVRNLAVTPSARKQLLEQGLLDPCLRLTDKLNLLTAQPVIFKLMATMRLVIDGNAEAACKIGRNRAIVTTIVSWANCDSQALKSEASRLLAALIKHAKTAEVAKMVAETGGLAQITPMLTSPHVKMRNEALVSLSVVAASLDADQVHAHLHTDLVVNAVRRCIIGNSGDTPEEVRKNALTFTEQLMRSRPEEFAQILRDLKFKEDLEASERALALEGVTEMLKKL